MMLSLIIISYNLVSFQFSSQFIETYFKLKNKPLPFFPGNIFLFFLFFKSDFSALIDLEKFQP